MSKLEIVAYVIFCEGEPRHLTSTRKQADKYAPLVGGVVMPVVSLAAAEARIEMAELEKDERLAYLMEHHAATYDEDRTARVAAISKVETSEQECGVERQPAATKP